jgi:hypothetical protein
VSDLASVRSRAVERRRELDRLAGEARSVGLEGQRVQADVAELEAQQALYERVGAVLSSFGEQRQAAAQQQIEQLVTRGLNVIFGEDLSFHLVSGEARKVPTVASRPRSAFCSASSCCSSSPAAPTSSWSSTRRSPT